MNEPLPSPAALLEALVARSGHQQKVLALTWHERWNTTAKRKLSANTVEPRLSDALADRADGWRFFFGDPRRSALLFDVLGATDAERDALTRGATERLAGGGHTPGRLLVDLHDLGGDALELLAAVEDTLLTDDRLGPAVVVLAVEQYRKLPITYAERKLELVKVADDAGADQARAERPHALVASTRPPPDAEGRPVLARWAAIGWNGKKLVIEPADAVDRFAREGALPGLPTVPDAHRLDTLGFSAVAPKKLPTGPALRERIIAIAAGTLALDPGIRLGEAAALGIVAASTDEERVRAALAAAGLPAEQPSDAAGLEHTLARARLRPAPPTVLTVAGAWHLVNVDVPAALAGHPRVNVHRIAAQPTALSRLAAATAGRTATAWELDPRLERVLAALDPEGSDPALAHARAWLVYGKHLAVAPDVACPDGIERLQRLLAHDAPPAEQHVVWHATSLVAQVYTLRDLDEPKEDVWTQVPPVGAALWHSREDWLAVAWGCRARTLGAFRDRWGGRDTAPAFAGELWEGGALVPADPPMDDDAWLDAYEARGPDLPSAHLKHRHEAALERAALRRARDTWEAQRTGRSYRHFGSFSEALESARREVDGASDDLVRTEMAITALADPDWAELDLALGLAWAALRAAFATSTPTRLHDGRWLLPVAPGLLAELRLVAAPLDEPVRAAFGRTLSVSPTALPPSADADHALLPAPEGTTGLHAAFSRIFGPVHAWEAQAVGIGTVRIGTTVPRTLHLLGEGVACTLRFVADPYGLAARAGQPSVETTVAGVAAAAAAAIRHRNDD